MPLNSPEITVDEEPALNLPTGDQDTPSSTTNPRCDTIELDQSVCEQNELDLESVEETSSTPLDVSVNSPGSDVTLHSSMHEQDELNPDETFSTFGEDEEPIHNLPALQSTSSNNVLAGACTYDMSVYSQDEYACPLYDGSDVSVLQALVHHLLWFSEHIHT